MDEHLICDGVQDYDECRRFREASSSHNFERNNTNTSSQVKYNDDIYEMLNDNFGF